MAIMIKTPQEIAKMRRSGEVLQKVLHAVREVVAPGVSTMDLEKAAASKIAEFGATPAFKGYHGYPACLCTSVNDEVIHGIPSAKKILAEGDVVSVDCGVVLDGFYSDSAVTIPVGKVSPAVRKLLDVTEQSLAAGIQEAQVGATIGDIGATVQEAIEANGFGIVRDFVGHGIGRSMHEDPQIPNYGTRGKGPKLRAGMVLAIEPMVNIGSGDVKVLKDGWTAVTVDGKWSAHFEHTVAVTESGPVILTR
ncbi:MAG: type I methionyl aminopeptidase [Acidobacteriaceae bacterium]|nr:type I methionyl aminopeptidase [Acidobacteriaceae bacterium]